MNEYKLKEKVWIHIGERNLVEGRVVEVIDLTHLNEGHSPDRELYIIELKTGIDDVYEVRTFDEISPDAKGPINLFRKHKITTEQRYLKKVGIILPIPQGVSIELEAENDPSSDEIHAAIQRAEQSTKHVPMSPGGAGKPNSRPKRRYFKKSKE